METFLGWALTVAGFLFILVGLAAAVRDLIGKATSPREGLGVPDLTKISKVLIELIKTLAQAPMWLACAAVGIGLIVWGQSMV